LNIEIPELCLVLLVGASGSGKSTFARKHFLPTEVISSDFCRALLADDENDQSVTKDAFELLNLVVAKRLKSGRPIVVDATNVQPAARRRLIDIAKEHHVFCVAIVFDLPESVLLERHAGRGDRDFGAQVIRRQLHELRSSFRGMQREGLRFIHVFKDPDQVESATIDRTRLWTNLKHETGPFDIVGDVHGCIEELRELVATLGYEVADHDGATSISHPQGRKLVFVGDLVDRGPDSPAVIRFVQAAVHAGAAFCVAGNHDSKLAKALQGRSVKVSHGLELSLQQLQAAPPDFRKTAADFLDGLLSHYVLDGGRLVVAHAGLTEELHGRTSARVRSFAMYGETTGETDEFGLPVRYSWAKDYRGKAMVVYGHTPVPEAEWVNNTICLDTGCVFGGKLTALRYPEREIVSVPARREYYAPVKPLASVDSLSAQQVADDVLDIADVLGQRFIDTRLRGRLQIPEQNAAAALEIMSRFAANPRWVIYLPPTMSPSETSEQPGLLEHPAEAFAYYRNNGVAEVICEEKHMGSRAVVIVCRNEDTVRRRFGIADEGIGIIYTRTGRSFFADKTTEQSLLRRLATAVTSANLWDELETDWLCLDCELLPWSAKAMDLIRSQYAPVGTAGAAMLTAVSETLKCAVADMPELAALRDGINERLTSVEAYRAAYAQYCAATESIENLRLAPFHLLASENAIYVERDHTWHMSQLARLANGAPDFVIATPHRKVRLDDEVQCEQAIEWWQALTQSGGEGMVVKPLDFVARGKKGLLQPAIKCRGPEYLRIIYGPEYLRKENLVRLRERNLGTKRALALKEFALGIESLQRFVDREPLRRMHECVFGVLALESEPVDPRL
jgi:protein phosphatase